MACPWPAEPHRYRNRPSRSAPGGNPGGAEWVSQVAPFVEQSLSCPGGLGGHRRLEACDKRERTQHVIGPNSGCQLPNDRRHYRTDLTRAGARRRFDTRCDDRSGDGRVDDHGVHEGGPHVDLPPSGRDDPLDDERRLGEQGGQRGAQIRRLDAGQFDRPAAGVDPIGQCGALRARPPRARRSRRAAPRRGPRRVRPGPPDGSTRSRRTRPRSPRRSARHRSRTAGDAG